MPEYVLFERTAETWIAWTIGDRDEHGTGDNRGSILALTPDELAALSGIIRRVTARHEAERQRAHEARIERTEPLSRHELICQLYALHDAEKIIERTHGKEAFYRPNYNARRK